MPWRSFTAETAYVVGGWFLGPAFYDALMAMRAAEKADPEHAARRRAKRLSRLLTHAAGHVPFYRGLPPELDAFPVLAKADYLAHPPEAFDAVNLPDYRRIRRSTSGSTGQPFAFSIDRAALPVIFASHLYYDSWFGLHPFDRYIRVASPPAPVPPMAEGRLPTRVRQSVMRRLQAAYEKRTQRKFLVWEVNGERSLDFWREYAEFRPDYVMGYTSSLAAIADELLARDLRPADPPRAVVTIAETLTESRRLLIERYFRAPIANRYGLRELGSWSGQSCRHSTTGFHINTELVVCEILREDGSPCAPGEVGRVVLTDLHNFARPFIRYFTGDLAAFIPGACPCGRTFPTLGRFQGRSAECLRTPSGKVIAPVVLGHYLFVFNRNFDAVRHYQLVQVSEHEAVLLVVPSPKWNEEARVRLLWDMESLLGGEMKVRLEIVAEIPLERSGKRPIIKLAYSGVSGRVSDPIRSGIVTT